MSSPVFSKEVQKKEEQHKFITRLALMYGIDLDDNNDLIIYSSLSRRYN
jgi:hypothetical protein